MNKHELTEMIREVMKTMAKDSLKAKLKKMINESMEEIKNEQESCINADMAELSKIVEDKEKTCSVVKDDKGNYNIDGIPPHNFSIRPKSAGIYDVVYFKDTTDREKKLNLNIDDLKEYVKSKISKSTLNYVKTAYNKAANNSIDKVEKVPDSIKHDIVTKKEVKDTKNDNKDYTELNVKEDDMPDKPFKEVEKIKKQNEHPIKGTKPEYKYPKSDKKDSKITIKRKEFKGRPRKNS